MYVNKLISLLISIRFSFIFSWKDSGILYSRYEHERMQIQENPAIILNDICTADKQMWAAMCRKTFQLLRQDNAPENPYRYSLYMNYLAFNISDQCGTIKIRISSGETVDQKVSFCYGRASVTPPTHTAWIGNWPHFNEISIYSGIGGTMMVFKCHGVECSLLEWYAATEWSNLPPVVNYFFQSLVPETVNNDETELASRLYHSQTISDWGENVLNILWKSNVRERRKLCDVLYARPEYNGRVSFNEHVYYNVPYGRNIRAHVQLNIQHADLIKTIRVPAFICDKFKVVNNFQYYKLMAGPGNDSVILLKPSRKHHFSGHIAIEWVKNIYYFNSISIDQNY